MIDYYENLMEDEQKKVSEVIETLYKQTFLLERIYDKRNKRYVLNKELANNPFFIELKEKYPNVINELQKSTNSNPLSTVIDLTNISFLKINSYIILSI